MLTIAVMLAVVIGISLGLLGGGGSILTLPILRYVLDMEAHQAVAVSLLVVGTTSAFAMIPHALKGRVRWRTGALFGAAGMVGAYGAGRIAAFLPSGLLLGLFGAMMLVTAVAMMRGRKITPDMSAVVRDLPVGKVLAEGLVVGGVTGLVGAGGGFLVVPALVLLGGLPMDIAVGTSLVVIAMKSFAGFAGYLSSTSIDGTVAALITAAAVVGSFVGSALAGRIPPDRLRKGFAWFVVAMAFFILGQELPRALGHPVSILMALLGMVVGTSLVAVVTAGARRLSVAARG